MSMFTNCTVLLLVVYVYFLLKPFEITNYLMLFYFKLFLFILGEARFTRKYSNLTLFVLIHRSTHCYYVSLR